MRTGPAGVPPAQGLARAQSWEDPALLGALAVGPEDDVLCLEASGDDALALVIAGAGSVTVAVPTVAARALVELKIAAVRELPVQSVRSLFGLGHFGRRVWFYHYLRAGLSADTQRFWDADEAGIRTGLLALGAVEREMAVFRSRILPLALDRGAVDALLAATTADERRALVAAAWGLRWRAALRLWAPRLARLAAAGATDGDGRAWEGGDAARRLHDRLSADPADDVFLRWLLAGSWPDLEWIHPWLGAAGHAALRPRLAAVQVVLAAPDALLAQASPGAWSAVVLGRGQLGPRSLAALGHAVRPGGRVLGWAGAVLPADMLGPSLRIDAAASAELEAGDRGLFPGRPWLAVAR
jgi:S-adenosylmethionine-diacylglycerol 3-amino-3-carboxypropyl transferase